MTEVLIHHEERQHPASSGLRRNRSSTSLLAVDKRQAAPIRVSSHVSRRNILPATHNVDSAPSPRPRKRPSRPSIDTSKPLPSPSHLRRSASETAISQPPRPRKAHLPINTAALPPALDHNQTQAPPSSPLSRSPPSTHIEESGIPSQPSWLISEDDLAVKEEPNKRVDYLSHPWTTEELSTSWRYIVQNRPVFGDLSRLENSAWRSWWKTMKALETLDPERLNWFKDNDVTWLYGPLHVPDSHGYSLTPSEPPSQLSKTNSFLTKKSILKKRSMSEILLQKSLSNSSLLRQAATAAQLQQDRPKLFYRRQSDFTPATMTIREGPKDYVDCFSSSSTSEIQTPSDLGERKHIQFAEQVEQCIAVETKGHDDDDDARSSITCIDDDYSGDDGFLMMKSTRHKRRFPTYRPQRRHSSPGNTKMIESLPATILNDTPKREDLHDGSSHSLQTSRTWQPRSHLSPSPSAETIRPKNPAKNFLISGNDDLIDDSENSSDAEHSGIDEEQMLQTAQQEVERQRGLRRTASGMLMPTNGEEATDQAFGGFVGTILETVHTARDIAHVVWNVGWRR